MSNQPPGGFSWNLGQQEPDDEHNGQNQGTGTQPSGQYPAPPVPPANFPQANLPPANFPPASAPPAQQPPAPYPPAGQFPPQQYPPAQYPQVQYPQATGQPLPSPPAPTPPPQYPAAPPPPFQPPQFGQSPAQPGFPPAQPQAPFQPPSAPTEAFVFSPTEADHPFFDDVPTQAMPFQLAPAATPEQPTSFGTGLPGLREDHARPSAATTGIDALFGETAFQEYDPGLIPADGLSALVGGRARTEARPPMSRAQKALLGVAAGLGGLLILVALFGIGTKIELPKAEPAPENTAPPAAVVAVAPPVGPVAAGEHAWDGLLGTECVDPFSSAWQETYIVVDCNSPHAAQMIHHGIFDDEAFAAYPGADVLQSRVNLLCTPAAVIDYAAAKTYDDIQFSASYPATDAQWNAGNRSYYCFINRASGDLLEASVAKAPVAATEPIASIPSNDP